MFMGVCPPPSPTPSSHCFKPSTQHFILPWLDLPHSGSNLSNSHSPSHSIQCILLLQPNTPVSCSPSPLAFSMSSLVVLASSFPSLQIPMLFSKHAHHPSFTHAHTISLHSLLPSEPLFQDFSPIKK